MNYYNEIDPFAASWLRNLMYDGHIPWGEVDERSIEDVTPNDLEGFTQCHFFAGIGGWSYALELAGWPEDKPVWTGSCPCQPFSSAGKGAGFDDERHLWPSWHWLIEQCQPAVVFGEQVASGAAKDWVDLVSFDLETLGYAFGSVSIPACGVGAPHIRQRAWFVADTDCKDKSRGRIQRPRQSNETGNRPPRERPSGFCADGELADSKSECARLEGGRKESGRREMPTGSGRASSQLGNPDDDGWQSRGQTPETTRHGRTAVSDGADTRTDPDKGFWGSADWLFCRDGKFRPVEPGAFPLAARIPSRMGRLRGYGNAINPEVAKEFIRAYASS